MDITVLADPQNWIALVTLLALEVVLGIDNVIFISILAGKLPLAQQARGRLIGLALAMVMRIALLFSLSWIVRLTAPLFSGFGQEISGRDLILIVGGLFLLAKSTHEIHQKLEGDPGHTSARVVPSFGAVLVQIMLLDVVFSLDSVITAVGMVDHIEIMIAAVVGAVAFMMVFAGAIGEFVDRPPDGQDAGAELPAADRRHPDRRRFRSAHFEGLHLLRDGVLGVRRDAELAAAEAARAAGQAARAVRVTARGSVCVRRR